jgi:hypothetical protein
MNVTDNIATDLFYKIRSRFRGLKLGTEDGTITINPQEARFFDFDYTEGINALGHVSISLAEENSMKVYFSSGITTRMDPVQKTTWYSFLRELRQFSKRRLMSFDNRDISKDNLDERDYAFLSQNALKKQQHGNNNKMKQDTTPDIPSMGESVMNENAMYGTKNMSFQKLMDTRLIIKHSQPLVDDMQPGARTRHISALFVENQDGERFKYPFIHLSGARAMQRHVANEGVPYDDIGKSIISMSEQIAQLRSFNSYVSRNDLMNSDTNSIVERSSTALNTLREQLKKLSRQNYYESYKQGFTIQEMPEVPLDVVEDFTQKFTVRNFKEDIKTVFPVLYKLMQEDSEIDYDDIVDMTSVDDEPIHESTEEDYDPFAQFEEWAMTLGERSAIQEPDQQESSITALNQLMGQEFPAGVDGVNAIESLSGIIEDPSLFSAIKQAAKSDPETCVRPLVKQWLESNTPELLDSIDFGDTTEENFEGIYQEENMSNIGDTNTQYGQFDLVLNGWHNPKFDPSDTDNDIGEEIPIGINYTASEEGSYYPANQEQPAENPDLNIEFTEIIDLETGEDITDQVDADELSEYLIRNEYVEASGQDYDMESREDDYGDNHRPKKSDVPAAIRKSKGGDWKTTPSDIRNDRAKNMSSSEWIKNYNKNESSQNSNRVNSKELAEFIHSFYDKASNSFPKGPESVATMVGKKFGEQAENAARKFVERMAPRQTDNTMNELSRIHELSGISKPITDDAVNELDYDSFSNSDELQMLRDAIKKNILVSVAFVKKDGTVKHMGVKSNLSSYVHSTNPKTDKQANAEQNNDIKKVVDINAYIKKLKELKAAGMEETQAKSEAAKTAWRSINLKNVLGFMVRGQFVDLRDENEIQQRFGDDIYNSVTSSMKSVLAQTQAAAESPAASAVQGEAYASPMGNMYHPRMKNDELVIDKIVSVDGNEISATGTVYDHTDGDSPVEVVFEKTDAGLEIIQVIDLEYEESDTGGPGPEIPLDNIEFDSDAVMKLIDQFSGGESSHYSTEMERIKELSGMKQLT